jgi:hypothetical protein
LRIQDSKHHFQSLMILMDSWCKLFTKIEEILWK